MSFVLATANPHKAAEIYTVFSATELLPRPVGLPVVEESAETLFGNALLKARAVTEFTGQPAIADDTGLEIEAYRGILGPRTARFAPDATEYKDKMALVLELLSGLSANNRTARFITVALAYFPDGRIVHAEGRLDGRIAEQLHGSNGFGYDPIFLPTCGNGQTYAEMSFDQQVRISHRTRAFRQLRIALGM